MKADFHVVIDACVLANHAVCDLLLRLAERPRLFLPHWSEQILREVHRTHVDKLDWPGDLADRFQREVTASFPEAMVNGIEPLMAGLSNDLKDRHVVAAAIAGGCERILTFNLRHFREEHLRAHGVVAVHPADYLVTLYEMEPKQVLAVLGEIAGRRRLDIEDLLLRLGKVLPKFAQHVLLDLTG